jgi:hypothetical protein
MLLLGELTNLLICSGGTPFFFAKIRAFLKAFSISSLDFGSVGFVSTGTLTVPVPVLMVFGKLFGVSWGEVLAVVVVATSVVLGRGRFFLLL